jgi:nickel/cobalt transporter (NicO) family protein
MPSHDVTALCTLAVTTGVIHTLAGPDHYLPFVVMARARHWSAARTTVITALCGLGHVLSSVLLGAIGIALGLAVSRMEAVEGVRGDLAGWLMVVFGIVYAGWGLRRRGRGHVHLHSHPHGGGAVHSHTHDHEGSHVHVHDAGGERGALTPWILFTVFVFGPCEVLIPLLLVPAAVHSASTVALVAGVFGTATIGTMLAVVLLLRGSLRAVRLGWLERNVHPLAGTTIALCGLLIVVGL